MKILIRPLALVLLLTFPIFGGCRKEPHYVLTYVVIKYGKMTFLFNKYDVDSAGWHDKWKLISVTTGGEWEISTTPPYAKWGQSKDGVDDRLSQVDIGGNVIMVSRVNKTNIANIGVNFSNEIKSIYSDRFKVWHVYGEKIKNGMHAFRFDEKKGTIISYSFSPEEHESKTSDRIQYRDKWILLNGLTQELLKFELGKPDQETVTAVEERHDN